jgi:hypothetical protein
MELKEKELYLKTEEKYISFFKEGFKSRMLDFFNNSKIEEIEKEEIKAEFLEKKFKEWKKNFLGLRIKNFLYNILCTRMVEEEIKRWSTTKQIINLFKEPSKDLDFSLTEFYSFSLNDYNLRFFNIIDKFKEFIFMKKNVELFIQNMSFNSPLCKYILEELIKSKPDLLKKASPFFEKWIEVKQVSLEKYYLQKEEELMKTGVTLDKFFLSMFIYYIEKH